MRRDILTILVDKRDDTALTVQEILTKWGSIIRTRLGLHGDSGDINSSHGLIIVDMDGTGEQFGALASELEAVKGVVVKHVSLSMET